MSKQEKRRPSVSATHDGRGLQKDKTSNIILRLAGYPVNDVFSCGFLYQVFCSVSEPITLEQLAKITDSSYDRIWLAIHDLRACGVDIGVFTDGT